MMNRQQVFATTLWGFDKKAVLDYIYEQDMQFKKKEADYEQQIAGLNERLEGYDSVAPVAEQYQEQLEALSVSYNEEKETAQGLQARYDKLSVEIDGLLRVASNKERELQLQLELNNQLKCKCETLEDKLKVLADHLVAERELLSSLPDPSIIPHIKASEQQPCEPVATPSDTEAELAEPVEVELVELVEAPQLDTDRWVADELEPCAEVVDLKVELDEFRQSVSKTLLNFEAALARLQLGKPDDIAEENTAFFR